MSKTAAGKQNFIIIKSSQLLDEAKALNADGYRFCQACADRTESGFELIYSFYGSENLKNIKFNIKEDEEIDSITFVYWTAFSSELDMAKEFGIKFRYVAAEHTEDFYKSEKISLSFEEVRKNIESMVSDKDYSQMVYAAERVSGICSFGDSLGYCMAVESAAGIDVPVRAEYLRVIIHELARIQSHLFCLAEIAGQIGFELLSVMCLNVRENILGTFDEIAGSRIMLSFCKVGGLKEDISAETLENIVSVLKESADEVERIASVFSEDTSVIDRLKGIGILDVKTAEESCVGPAARASEVARDARKDENFWLYRELGFEPVVKKGGDCFARCMVKIGEISQSADMIERLAEEIPEGDICAEIGELKAGEAAVRIEQPDGQAFYYVKSSGSEFLKRFSMRMPEDVNMPAFVRTMKLCDPADMSILALTMEPCVNDTKWKV